MSIAFRKKDYHYDGDDIECDDALAEGDEDEQNHQDGKGGVRHNAYAVPSEQVMELYEELQDIAHSSAVEIFDQLTPLKLAEFVSQYTEDAFV